MSREVFEAALLDMESLPDLSNSAGIDVASFEEFQTGPRQVHEQATGRDMADAGVERPTWPSGAKWSEEGDDSRS